MDTLVIQRYSNRKLYGQGRFFGLDDIIRLIKEDKPFKILDKRGTDITSVTVARAVADNVSVDGNILDMLKNIVKELDKNG